MANETIKFDPTKLVVGGIRNDAAPTTYNGEPCSLRMNSAGELVVSVGSTVTLAISGPDDHDAAITSAPVLGGAEAADFDGAALPNAVDAEGDAVNVKASLSGVPYFMPVNEDGSATPLVPEATAAGEGLQISLDDGTNSVFAQGDTTGNLRNVGNVAHDAVDSGDPVKGGFRARNTLIAAVTENDRSDMTGDLYGRLRVRAASFDELSATETMTIGNGPETQYKGGTLADITNAAAGPIYYYVDMSGFNHLSLQFEISSGTPTLLVEGTLEDNGTAAPSCAYQDIGLATYGAATWTTDSILVDDAGKTGGYHFIRVSVAGSGSEDLEIFYKKWYA